MQGSGLPSLLQSRLNAPRILKITKVASYVLGKLADDGLSFEPHRLYHDASWQAQLEVCFPPFHEADSCALFVRYVCLVPHHMCLCQSLVPGSADK